MIGMPECDVLLSQCVVYLVRAPKSNLIYNALQSAKNIIVNHKGPQPSVPLHIRDRSGQRKLNAIIGEILGVFVCRISEKKYICEYIAFPYYLLQEIRKQGCYVRRKMLGHIYHSVYNTSTFF